MSNMNKKNIVASLRLGSTGLAIAKQVITIKFVGGIPHIRSGPQIIFVYVFMIILGYVNQTVEI